MNNINQFFIGMGTFEDLLNLQVVGNWLYMNACIDPRPGLERKRSDVRTVS